MYRALCRHRSLCVAACVLLVAAAWVGGPAVKPARAQMLDVAAIEHRSTQQPTHLFASWNGDESFHGFILSLPAGWRFESATMLRAGFERVPVVVRALRDQQVLILSDRPLSGPHELLFEVETSATAGSAEWTLTPVSRTVESGGARIAERPAFAARQQVRVETPQQATENRVLSFSPKTEGERDVSLLLRRSALPDMSLRSGHSVEFWMKTARLSEVVLSTWNGDESQAYPLEFVVDRGGRLVYYRGRPGSHQSMTTRRPVADGRWHHVALAHDPRSGWTKLFLNGQAADSLYSEVPLAVDLLGPVAVGGRIPNVSPSTADSEPFTGMLDELIFWPFARAASGIQRTMRQPLRQANGQGVHLGFEEAVPADLVDRRSPRTRRVLADLTFHAPLRNLRAAVEGRDVSIAWEAQGELTRAFVLERSSDGRVFEEAGRLAPEGGEGQSYRLVDRGVNGHILYYRIRQVFKSGADRVSGVIKIGLGEDVLAGASLIGNFPNPFNPTTTITYEVRSSTHVRVSVWDLSGQQIAVLVDEEKGAGVHEANFVATDLPSGTYFVRLRTPDHMESHKMILMK